MEKQYLDYEGLERFKGKLHEGSNIFPGTLEEWEALTEEEQAKYDFIASPDEATGDIADAVTDGDMRPVTSNAVHDALYKTSVVAEREPGSQTTLADMLNELFNNIDASKMTEKATLIYYNPGAQPQLHGILTLSNHAIDWSEMTFVGFLNEADSVGIITMNIKSASSSAQRWTLTTNGVTLLDISSIMWMFKLELIY